MSSVAVVTGSNKGIGLAVVKQLCQQFTGAVYLTARDEERGIAAVKELEKEGLTPKFHQLDITDPASIERLRDHLKETYGGLDILVNNAGIAFKSESTVPFGEQAEVTMGNNFFGTLNVCKLLFPLLRAHARVVTMSSVVGNLSFGAKEEGLKKKLKSDNLTVEELCDLMKQFVNHAKLDTHLANGWGGSAYAVSKVGLTALTRVQQREFNKDPREDIIVVALEPGIVDTDMTSHSGSLTPEQGAGPVVYCSLLPHFSNEYKGAYVSSLKAKVVEWE